ncbi:hypothetical protein C8Q70DRAFT_926078 [Cubamyces menziesii]|uniref:Uncharacterized protein n=1 Tax=Trametes cubensis TaxID=1111947 RepID=A0AAD7U416_9APHY|nr:hypothetical protein C8Q70DRAFT_926078 [Cubamyces menziesii]KAJ8502215.1 hypothetical protein ONZ51_g7 [Trametes cubensis]
MTPITLLAKVSGRTQSHPTHVDRNPNITYLEAPILPTSPLEVGSRVQVVFLEPKSRSIARSMNYRNEPKYNAYTSDIRGRIVGIRAMEAEVTELVLKNDNAESSTEFAYVAIPHLEGTTVRLSTWMKVVRWIVITLSPRTRRIPIEPLTAMEWTPA